MPEHSMPIYNDNLMTDDQLKNAVLYANQHFYSKPMTVSNHADMLPPIPYAPPLHKILPPIHRVSDGQGFETNIRRSHGLLHVVAAMELIDEIDSQYKKYELDKNILDQSFSEEELTQIKIATLFHDSGRQGDGIDLWDRQSAINCFVFLMQSKGLGDKVNPQMIEQLFEQDDDIMRISHEDYQKIYDDCGGEDFKHALRTAKLIQYKDNRAALYQFSERYLFKGQSAEDSASAAQKLDLARQYINMADSIEVIRCRDEFKLSYTPIARNMDPLLHELEMVETYLSLAKRLKKDASLNKDQKNEKLAAFFKSQRAQYESLFGELKVGICFDLNEENAKGKREAILEEIKKQSAQPFGEHQSYFEKIKKMTRELIVPHRAKISEQGRQNDYKAKIVTPGFVDFSYDKDVKIGYNNAKLLETTKAIYNKYDLSPINTDDNSIDIEKARQCAISGLKNYLEKHQSWSFSFMHHGMFSPRFHGETGRNRASRYIMLLESDGNDHANGLKQIFNTSEGQTLQEEVMDFLGVHNKETILKAISNNALKEVNLNDDAAAELAALS
jgi:hypothetical protein